MTILFTSPGGARLAAMNGRHVAAVAVMFFLGTRAFIAGAPETSAVADAVMNGDAVAVRRLVAARADVNAPQVDGATALHWAIYHDDLPTTDLLLKAGADVKAANREGATPLMMASLYGNAAILERLLTAGADAMERGPNGETTVMLAARNGNPSAIRLLVAAGADVNAKEALRATTALMWAAEQGHADAARSLIELGADVAAKSGPAGRPRNYMSSAVPVQTVEAAAKRRREARAAGRTYEEQLAFEQANGSVPDDRVSQAVAFVASGAATVADVVTGLGLNPQQAAELTALVRAATAGTGPAGAFGTPAPNAAAAAAAADAANQQDVIIAGLVGGGSGGLTPLVFAAREGGLEMARALVEGGADVNQQTEYGWTPLLVATNNRHYRLGAYLLEHGADPNIANKGGWTPLYLATDNRNIEGGDYPVPRPDMDHLEYIKLLLDRKADTNARVKENTLSRTIFTMQWFFEPGATAFVRAAQSSDLALMKLLLEHGADPKAETGFGDTALTAAGGIGWVEGVTYERSVKENLEAVRLLLDLGLDPNHANKDGRTAIMGAAHKGRNDVIQLLVDRGAKLDARDFGSRDTGNAASPIAGHKFQVLDYSEGLVRVGVQSAVPHPETAELIRKMLADRGLPVPPPNRNVDSICVVEICQ